MDCSRLSGGVAAMRDVYACPVCNYLICEEDFIQKRIDPDCPCCGLHKESEFLPVPDKDLLKDDFLCGGQ